MIHRSTFVALAALLCAQATLTASTSYSFGTNSNVSFDPGSGTTYSAGVWTEVYTGGSGTSEQIDCVVAVANITNVCGNPGPGNSAHISIPSAPGNSAILPLGTTNYLLVDGDNSYGAPVWTNMTGLIVGESYTLSFDQATTEEDGNNKAYNDNWQVYIIPGGTQGSYICPVCSPAVNPLPGDLAFSSQVIANSGGVSTPWELETYTFTATSTSEILEFVTNAVATTSGSFMPPMLALAGVSIAQVPEPTTWALTLLGAGAAFAAGKLRRRRPSAAYRRVMAASESTFEGQR